MKVNVIDIGLPDTLFPIICEKTLTDYCLAGHNLKDLITERIQSFLSPSIMSVQNKIINIRIDYWPKASILEELLQTPNLVVVRDNIPYLWISSSSQKKPQKINEVLIDVESSILKYPWDLLALNEELVGKLSDSKIEGTVKNGVNVDGHVIVGKGSVLLPGVYIEGNAIIGENCKIGPNCYIRGNTSIGNNCHIGQAVEIKNSMIMNKVGIGHLSYIGDSIICDNTNIGAGTITANLRHDGKNNKSMINGKLLDTGRRKLGVIIGNNVHTGIHTTLYPGRKLWPNTSTLPGEIIKEDKKE